MRLLKIAEAYDCCHGLKRQIGLVVLTADYLTSDNEPNPSARRGKQACLALVCSYHAIGNAVFESCAERISMKTSAIGSFRQLDSHSLRRRRLPEERTLLERATEQVLLGPKRKLRVR